MNNHSVKKVLNCIYRTVILSILIISIISTIIYKKPSFLGYRLFYVPTASMEPIISTGSFVLARCTKPSDLSPGDIAVYKSKNTLIIHRILSFDGDYVRFKGDNNDFSDPPVKKDKVLYKVL